MSELNLTTASLAELNTARLQAKEAENDAKKLRVAIEDAMIAHQEFRKPDTADGLGTVKLEGLCNVTFGETAKWDQDALAEFHDSTPGIEEHNWPFKTEYKVDGTKMKYLAENHPQWLGGIQNAALTTKPSKPSFKELSKK